jgi:hypothetical protein
MQFIFNPLTRYLKSLVNQQKYANIKVEKDIVEKKIAKGIKELDNGEGSDFRLFLKEVNRSYGSKK